MSMMVGIKKGPKSDINITPYIDILLVLLIIFMVVTPIRQRDLKVKVPRPSSPPPPIVEVKSDAIVLTVHEHGQIDINNISTDFNALGSKLREIFRARSNKNLFINGSPKLPYSAIVRVIDISKGAGVADIGLMSEEIH